MNGFSAFLPINGSTEPFHQSFRSVLFTLTEPYRASIMFREIVQTDVPLARQKRLIS